MGERSLSIGLCPALTAIPLGGALRGDWSRGPFVWTERDGWFYCCGTFDVEGGAATLVTAFCSLRQRGVVPERDLILALTADEEGGPNNGIQWLLANRRDLIDAAYAINLDSGGPEIRGGRVSALLKIQRFGHNDRVTFDVENLPFGVIVDDIGLNGILIPEGATERRIFLTSAAWTPEAIRPCYARIRETPNATSAPVLLRVPGR